MDCCWKIEDVPDLYGYHFEGNTRFAFHTSHADSDDPGNCANLDMQC